MQSTWWVRDSRVKAGTPSPMVTGLLQDHMQLACRILARWEEKEYCREDTSNDGQKGGVERGTGRVRAVMGNLLGVGGWARGVESQWLTQADGVGWILQPGVSEAGWKLVPNFDQCWPLGFRMVSYHLSMLFRHQSNLWLGGQPLR